MKYTMQLAYDLSSFAHITVDAETSEEACQKAIDVAADSGRVTFKDDYESSSAIYVVGAVEGEHDDIYETADSVPVPGEHSRERIGAEWIFGRGNVPVAIPAPLLALLTEMLDYEAPAFDGAWWASLNGVQMGAFKTKEAAEVAFPGPVWEIEFREAADVSGGDMIEYWAEARRRLRTEMEAVKMPAPPSALELIGTMKGLIDEAITNHIYDESNGEEPDDDCGYTQAVKDADAYMAIHAPGEEPAGLLQAVRALYVACGEEDSEEAIAIEQLPTKLNEALAEVIWFASPGNDPAPAVDAAPGQREIVTALIAEVGALDDQIGQMKGLLRGSDSLKDVEEAQEGAEETVERARIWLDKAPREIKIGVHMDGGMIQSVWSEIALPGVEVTIIDYDTEGSDRDDLSMVRNTASGEWVEAHAYTVDLSTGPFEPVNEIKPATDSQFDDHF